MKNYYKVLEINESAQEGQIKRQYKLLILKHHPDKNGGSKKSEETFKEIQEAYTVLSNIESRRLYDAQLKKYREAANRPAQSQKAKNQSPPPQPEIKVNFEELLIDIMFERKRKTTDGQKIAAGILFLFKTFRN